MSVFSTIKTDVEKFFKGTETEAEKFAVAFEGLLKKSPTALQSLENFTGSAALVIEAAVALAAPAAEPVVTAALATTETALGALQASATAAVSGGSLMANLQNFATTVPQLLTGIAIKNPALQAAVTKIVNLVVGEAKVLIPAVEAWIAQIKATSTPAAPATAPAQ